MKKYNQFYTHLQSHSRGEITLDELQGEASKLFLKIEVSAVSEDAYRRNI